jgi:MFS family permease
MNRAASPVGNLAVSIALGITQTIGYGSLYYAYGVLAPAMAEDTGHSLTAVYGFFSLALLAGGFVAPAAGRALDRFNSAFVMGVGSVIAAVALAVWALAPGKIAFAVFALGIEMVSALVLYDAAFVVAARLAPHKARRTITGITLIAGFASTIFWPMTSWLSNFLSWREVYLVYAGMNLLICAPMHFWLSTRAPERARVAEGEEPPAPPQAAITDPRARRRLFLILLVAFAANSYVVAAVHLHLIGLLGALGVAGSAALIGALIGPSQVAGRAIEFAIGERVGVLSVAIFATAALPAGLSLLIAGPGYLPAAIGFAVLFGLGQGLSYIVRGVLPLHLFGHEGYGTLLGKFNSARLFVSAAAPVLTAALFERSGVFPALVSILFVGLIGVVGLLAVIPAMRSAASKPPAQPGV